MWQAEGLTVESCIYYPVANKVEISFDWEGSDDYPYLVTAWAIAAYDFVLPFLDENLPSGSYDRTYSRTSTLYSLMFFKRNPAGITTFILEIKAEDMEAGAENTAEQSVTLAAGESQVVSFEVIPEEAKTYQVAVGGLSESFICKKKVIS